MDAAMTNQARSFSQGTTNFGLPQWEPNDKPTFLVDMNGAYRTIDTQMQANKNDANSAITAAESANTLSNQALTASRENAQNIVTLTNNLTTSKEEINEAINSKGSFFVTNILSNSGEITSEIRQPAIAYQTSTNFGRIIKLTLIVRNLTPNVSLESSIPIAQLTFSGAQFKTATENFCYGSTAFYQNVIPGYVMDSLYVHAYSMSWTGNTVTVYAKTGFTPKGTNAIIIF